MDAKLLKDIPLFAELPDEQLRGIAAFAALTQVSEGTHLVDEGDYSYELMVVRDGTARVVQGGDEVAKIGPGDLIGELGVVNRAQRNATVIADSTMTLVTLSHWHVRRLGKTRPELLEAIKRVASERAGSAGQ